MFFNRSDEHRISARQQINLKLHVQNLENSDKK